MDANGYGGDGIYMDDHTGLVDVDKIVISALGNRRRYAGE